MTFDQWRQQNRLSMADLGEALGVTHQHIHLIIKGKRKPSWDLANRIVTYTKGAVTVEDLLGPRSPAEVEQILPAPTAEAEEPQVVEGEGAEGEDLARLCVDVPADMVEELRAVVWWSGGDHSLTGLVRTALDNLLDLYRRAPLTLTRPHTNIAVVKPAGQPYPPREGAVKKGRRFA